MLRQGENCSVVVDRRAARVCLLAKGVSRCREPSDFDVLLAGSRWEVGSRGPATGRPHALPSAFSDVRTRRAARAARWRCQARHSPCVGRSTARGCIADADGASSHCGGETGERRCRRRRGAATGRGSGSNASAFLCAQAAWYANAAIVVTVHGSQTTNAIFADEGALVVDVQPYAYKPEASAPREYCKFPREPNLRPLQLPSVCASKWLKALRGCTLVQLRRCQTPPCSRTPM